MRAKMYLLTSSPASSIFFKRLESYTEVRPTSVMASINIKIMVEVLTILGIATKEIKQRKLRESVSSINYSWLTFL